MDEFLEDLARIAPVVPKNPVEPRPRGSCWIAPRTDSSIRPIFLQVFAWLADGLILTMQEAHFSGARITLHVVDPQVGLDDVRDVLLDGEVIVEVGVDLESPADAEVIDASGKYLVPGLVDMDQDSLTEIGIDLPVRDEVARLASLSTGAGADGIVCSPQEAAEMRALLGPDALIVTPGVRPSGAAVGDQRRVATPAAAIKAGASKIVVGRPVTAADDVVAAYESIVAELCVC